jgi:hypothetical protein
MLLAVVLGRFYFLRNSHALDVCFFSTCHFQARTLLVRKPEPLEMAFHTSSVSHPNFAMDAV